MKIITVLLTALFLSIAPSEKFLFIGDSLTCYRGGWQDQVTDRLHATSVNISKGGKRTDWMLSTLTAHLRSDSKYDKVFIYGGCNDAFSYVSLEGSVQNTQKMVDLCNQFKIKPIVILGYDPYKVMVNTPYKKDIAEFHKKRYVKLQNMLQAQLKNCKIIKVCPSVTDENAHDDIHLGESGHKKFADWVNQQLENM